MVSSLLYSFILLEVVIKTQYLLTYSHLSHFMKFNKRKEKRRKGAQGLYQVQRLNGQHLDGEGVIAEEIIC